MLIMRPVLFALLVLSSTAAQAAQSLEDSRSRRLGAGVQLGDPTGGTLKYWLDKNHALEAGMGFSGDFAAYGGISWYTWDILPQPGKGLLGAYVSTGPRIEAQRDAEFAVRAMAGASYFPSGRPLEMFVEVGPVFRFTPKGGVGVDGAIGVRFYAP